VSSPLPGIGSPTGRTHPTSALPVVASDQLAYALTRSNGTQIVHATGVESVESNREVFIFGREDGAWKISRYMFNKPH
jgi:hypothetical protein